MPQLELPLTRKVYSVGELCRDIKLTLEQRFSDGIWVEGEISNLRIPSSGHIYFSLKDSQAVVNAVMFRGQAFGLRFAPADGMKVLVFGTVGIYETRGNYQIVLQRMEPQGIGSMQMALEQLKEKLRLEGLFEEARKKPLPMLPQRLAIVTSVTGAAIRDILHVLDRRFSNLEISIYPVQVQGEGAAAGMAQAVKDLNDMGGFDLILVTRGGGSLEDLWPFNQEVLVRAITASRIPVVSAVGHEIDYTLCDLVADLRCPTPSAAAEMIIGRKQDLAERVASLRGDLDGALEGLVEGLHNRLQLATLSRGFTELQHLVDRWVQRVDDDCAAMALALGHAWEIAQKEFQRLAGKLDALSPLAVLARGYSITFAEATGKVLRRHDQAAVGDKIRTVLSKGEVFSKVWKVQEKP